MAASPDKSISPQVSDQTVGNDHPHRKRAANSDELSPEEVLLELTQLRERFRRTTNALASAAHDLKTPLSILNGYIELLRSEKVGSMNEKQREILGDIHSLEEELLEFERKYGLRSEIFYAAYASGEEPENDAWVLDFSEWASVYRTWLSRQAEYRNEIQQRQGGSPSLKGLIRAAA
jgi:signal transduction histidine kinase